MSYMMYIRGEGTEGYSESLRQLEFICAFRAEIKDYFLFNNNNICTDNDDTVGSSSMTSINEFIDNIEINFQDALKYSGPVNDPSLPLQQQDIEGSVDDAANTDDEFGGEAIPLHQVAAYESAMQYVAISLPSTPESILSIDNTNLRKVFISTIERCSLIRNAFQLHAAAPSYELLATKALNSKSFNDIMKDGTNENATWSIRLRRYGPMQMVENQSVTKRTKRQARYGKNVRSPLRDERKAIMDMKELVLLFHGKVDLTKPDCRIYLLEGLQPCLLMEDNDYDNSMYGDMSSREDDDNSTGESRKLLARIIAKGPKTSIYAPKTRICVTTTPLCPIASFTLCNIAQMPRLSNPTILDPFAGSCATLLAAAHITDGCCRSVAIEIAHNGYVNRNDVMKDFDTRSLPPPTEIIRGDCTSSEIRQQARRAIGNTAFDVIVTDPPYGIREAMGSSEEDNIDDNEGDDTSSISPLTQLFYAMGHDRANGTPLLKVGGRVVAFVPVRKSQSLEDCLPDLDAREAAGLVMEGEGKRQALNDILARWIVSFVCV